MSGSVRRGGQGIRPFLDLITPLPALCGFMEIECGGVAFPLNLTTPSSI